MTDSEKRLLSIDLCGRLPYGVKVRYMSIGEAMPQVWDLIGMPTAEHCDILVPNERRFSAVPIQDVKPYLRPLKETYMTEAEAIYYNTVYTCLPFTEKVDWLNEHMFDYRKLIEQGLALQSPERMYDFV